jgi:hypothetical protein
MAMGAIGLRRFLGRRRRRLATLACLLALSGAVTVTHAVVGAADHEQHALPAPFVTCVAILTVGAAVAAVEIFLPRQRPTLIRDVALPLAPASVPGAALAAPARAGPPAPAQLQVFQE